MTDNCYAKIKIKILQDLCIRSINITYLWLYTEELSSTFIWCHCSLLVSIKNKHMMLPAFFIMHVVWKIKTRGIYLLWLYDIMQRTQSADSFDFRKYLDARIQHNGMIRFILHTTLDFASSKFFL